MTAFLDPPEWSLDRERAGAVVVPVAYDATSTWVKGADRGPAAMLEASGQVEWLDVETETEPYRRGIATDDAITHEGSPDGLAEVVEQAVGAVLDHGQFPMVLGGEHSVSIGAIRAAASRAEARGKRLTVVSAA